MKHISKPYFWNYCFNDLFFLQFIVKRVSTRKADRNSNSDSNYAKCAEMLGRGNLFFLSSTQLADYIIFAKFSNIWIGLPAFIRSGDPVCKIFAPFFPIYIICYPPMRTIIVVEFRFMQIVKRGQKYYILYM